MVTLSDPPLIKTMTLHLQLRGGRWVDRFGTVYHLHAEGVDWSVFYRDRLLTYIRRGDPNANYILAKRMAHYVHLSDAWPWKTSRASDQDIEQFKQEMQEVA